MIKKKYLILILNLLSSLIAISQRTDEEMSYNATSFPPSPNAAALARFGDIPVSMYTGTPSIEVPLYTVATGDIAMAIKLSYHAGGFKVSEMASNVGLGWTIDGIGSISRTVRGIPDDASNGYLNNNIDVSSITGSNQVEMKQLFKDVNRGLIDLQSDIYYFSFLGKSGKFFIDKATQTGVILNANEKIKIERGITSSWVVTDNRGMKYFFGTFPTQSSGVERSVVEQDGRSIPGGGFNSPTAWHLVRVEDGKGNYIAITYEDYNSSYCMFNNKVKYIFQAGASCDLSESGGGFDNYEIHGKKISSISWNAGSVVFTYNTTPRTDLGTTDNALRSVEVFNNETPAASVIKWQMEHSYFSTTATSASPCSMGSFGPLRLDTIKQVAPDNSSLPGYIFTYNNQMPALGGYAQDYWGFNNGRDNLTLVPSLQITHGSSTLITDGADRSPNNSFSDAGLLTSIKYPTGGTTEFTYEGHDAYMADFSFEPTTSIPQMRYAIVRKDDMNNLPNRTARFTVNSSTAFVNGQSGAMFTLRVRVDAPCDPSVRDGGCGGDIYIQTFPGNAGAYVFGNMGTISGIQTRTFFLPNGTYDLVIEGYSTVNDLIYDYADLFGPDESQVSDGRYNKPIGGVRIAKIVSKDGHGPDKVTNYVYRQKDDPTRSSGALVDLPIFTSEFKKDVGDPTTECEYTAIYATSKAPLSSTQGSHIGYSYVEEIQGDLATMNINGKSGFEYTSALSIQDQGASVFPFAPKMSFDMKRGLLLKKTVYKYENAAFDPVRLEENVYELGEIRNLKNQYSMVLACNDLLSDGGCNEVTSKMYTDRSLWVWLKETKVTDYSSIGNLHSDKQVQYQYENENHLLPTRTATIASNQDIETEILKYPNDFLDSDLDQTTLAMKNTDHQLAFPLEKISLKGLPGQEIALGSTVYKYFRIGSGKAMLQSIYKRKLAAPVSFSNTSLFPVYRPISAISDAVFRNILMLTYNSSNAVVKEEDIQGKTAFVWDDNNQVPIAITNNADQSQIAYTSFEPFATVGGWSFTGSIASAGTPPPTGSRWLTAATVSKNDLPNGSYIVSYWRTGTSPFAISGVSTNEVEIGPTVNGWTFIKHKVVSNATTLTIAVPDAIDEVRLYPFEAQMKSITYKPLIGVTSEINEQGSIRHFEFDKFNRLMHTRDIRRNILTKYDYNYAQ